MQDKAEEQGLLLVVRCLVAYSKENRKPILVNTQTLTQNKEKSERLFLQIQFEIQFNQDISSKDNPRCFLPKRKEKCLSHLNSIIDPKSRQIIQNFYKVKMKVKQNKASTICSKNQY